MQGIFIGVVAAFVVLITIVGPEYAGFLLLFSLSLTNVNRKHGSHFEQHKAAFEQGAAEDDIPEKDPVSVPEKDLTSRGPDEKGSIHQIE